MLSDTEHRRLMAGLPSPLMEATVQDPAVDALGFLRVEIDNRPGAVESCPWQPRVDIDPRRGDAALVVESDGGHFWVVSWWSQSGASPTPPALPIGVPVPWLVAELPTGYIEFAGQAIDSSTQPQLAALFGATLPDLRGRTLIGASGSHPVGSEGGEETHLLTAAESGMRSHNHGGNTQNGSTPDHLHGAGSLSITQWWPGNVIANTFNQYAGIAGLSALDRVSFFAQGVGGATGGADRSLAHSHPISSQADAAAADAHNNLPPYHAVRWITRSG